jgi:cytochrome b6-f complex iron-sulfur subunit
MAPSRRKFLSALIGGGLAGWVGSILYPVVSFLVPPDMPEVNISSVSAGFISDFPADSSQILRFGRTPVILIRTAEGDFRAFSATCTHLDCIVQYRSDLKNIWCACHNGKYDMQGRNISGPPPRPLPPFEVQVVDDEIVVSKSVQVA